MSSNGSSNSGSDAGVFRGFIGSVGLDTRGGVGGHELREQAVEGGEGFRQSESQGDDGGQWDNETTGQSDVAPQSVGALGSFTTRAVFALRRP
jgi:hypothetical protein